MGSAAVPRRLASTAFRSGPDVVEKLVRLVGLTPEEIEPMTKAQAIGRLNQFRAEQ
ncbi:hypothetical protein [Nocardia sp. NPDC058705]|uniref:hypothetical protein n=1 Tax=Nocardia sp. NPDC058705 TaxID=3346609 RepID=UPI0036AE369B